MPTAFTCMSTFNPHNTLWSRHYDDIIARQGNGGIEGLGKLLKVTKWESGGAQTQDLPDFRAPALFTVLHR